MRRRLRLHPAAVIAGAGLAPAALCVAMPRNRARDVGLCALNMWAYTAAYKMPNDDPERLMARVHMRYPRMIDRVIGFGATPSYRLQRAFAAPGAVRRFERVLVWTHWVWFAVPHGSVAYVLLREPQRFPSAAARMYAVFDFGVIFYWVIPTAPPWLAAARDHVEEVHVVRVRRMMIEYGEQFWGQRWGRLYDVLGGNPVAAMPSLHFATSVMAARLLTEIGPVSGAVGWCYTGMLGVALVYLGEHYAVDLIAGVLLEELVRIQAPPATKLYRRVSGALQALEARAAGA